MKTTKVDYTLLSTTTSLGRVRGFTIELLFHLEGGSKRCCDLAEITEKTQPYINRYLRRMRNYGLTEKQGILWKLSPLGEDFLSYLKGVYNNIIIYRQKKDRKKKEERQKPRIKPKQVRISAWLTSSTRDEVEKRVVEILMEHYNKTGSKFQYFDDIYAAAESFKCTPDEIQKAMRNLKQDHVAYAWRDSSLGAWKIALYKDFVEGFKLLEENKV